jgi:hypothetical protein
MTEHQAPDKQIASSRDKAEVNATFQADDATEVRGTVRIAPAVLIQLIEVTVSDISGVLELKPRRRRKNDETAPLASKSLMLASCVSAWTVIRSTLISQSRFAVARIFLPLPTRYDARSALQPAECWA